MECLAMPCNALEFPFNLPATFASLLLPLACFPQLTLSCSFYFLLLHLPPAPSLLRPSLLTLLLVFFLPSSSFTFFFVLLVYVISKMDYVLLSVSLPLHLSLFLSLCCCSSCLLTSLSLPTSTSCALSQHHFGPNFSYPKTCSVLHFQSVNVAIPQRIGAANPGSHLLRPFAPPLHCLGTPCVAPPMVQPAILLFDFVFLSFFFFLTPFLVSCKALL